MKAIFIIACFFAFQVVYGQEDCFNGIDDDGDGLIDLNDSDCDCPETIVVNPLFDGPCEQPQFGWEGYFNTNYNTFYGCTNNQTGFISPPPPATTLVMLTTTSFFGIAGLIYQCLACPMLAGETYTISFDYFTDGYSSFPVTYPYAEVNVYGFQNCPDDLLAEAPLCSNSTDPNFPSPTSLEVIWNQPLNYVEDGWQSHSFTFTPTQDLFGISINALCHLNLPSEAIVLYTYISNFQIDGGLCGIELDPPSLTSGHPCSGMTYTADPSQTPESNPEVQWFLDGVAIQGATGLEYDVPINTTGLLSFGVPSSLGCFFSESIDLPEIPNVEIEGVEINNPCPELSEGEISITSILNSTPPYQYLWSNGSIDDNLSMLTDGTYTVTVLDANNCEGIQTFTISSPSLLGGEIINIQAVDPFSLVGSAEAVVDGGTPEYSYLWSNGGTDSVNNELEFGINTVTVTDSKGCTVILEVDVPITPLEVEVTVSESCIDDCTGEILINATGGGLPYQFLWSDGDLTQFLRINLCSGEYSVEIVDFFGQSVDLDLFVDSVQNFSLNYLVNQPECEDSLIVGDIFLEAASENEFSFLWSDENTNPERFGLASGNYSVTVADDNGCSEIYDFSIQEQAFFEPSIELSPLLCFGDQNAELSVSVDTLEDRLTYLWSTGANTPTISDLGAGNYQVTITDTIDQCSNVVDFEIFNPDTISFTYDYSPLICNGSNEGFINISASNLLLDAQWNDGDFELDRYGLIQGVYQITFIDSNNCEQLIEIEISEYDSINYSVSTERAICNTNSGSALVQLNPGIVESILWTGTMEDSIFIDDLEGGVYYPFELVDTNQCVIYDSVFIEEIPPLDYSLVVVDSICVNSNEGSILLDTNDSGLDIIEVFGNDLDALTVGTYYVQVTDSLGCTSQDTIEINNFAELTYDIVVNDESCNGSNDGSVEIVANQGTIIWEGNQESSLILDLSPGTYNLQLIDANNCLYQESIIINEGPIIQFDIEVIDDFECLGDTAIINVEAYGSSIIINEQNYDDGLIELYDPGFYDIAIIDASGICRKDTTIVLNSTSVEITSLVENTNCGATNGSIEIFDQFGLIDNFIWSHGDTSLSTFDLEPGQYVLTFADTNGCSSVLSFNIAESTLEDLIVENSPILCAGDNNGSISIIVNDEPIQQFLINNENYFSGTENLAPDIYNYSLFDNNGCLRVGEVTIGEPPPLMVEIIAQGNVTSNQDDGFVIIEILGGTPPYVISWSNGSSGDTLLDLTSGNYIAEIVDANGCTQLLSVDISDFNFSISESIENENCEGDCNGSVTISIESTFDYQVMWADGVVAQSRIELCAGTYAYQVIDSEGELIAENTITILEGQAINYLNIIPSGDSIVINEESITLSFDSSADVDIVNWMLDNEEICSGSILECQSINVNEEGMWSLEIISDIGCSKKDSTYIYFEDVENSVLTFPNVINLNSGNSNDRWTFIVPPNIQIVNTTVFDRWGNKVYNDRSSPPIWDGQMEGVPVVEGVYIAIIKYYDTASERFVHAIQDITVLR